MPNGVVLKQIDQIFGGQTVAGLGEGQLLERFVARRDEAAFEALVLRHGPMVLGVCRRLLRDPAEVEDAFQAVFLVLVRKAGSIRQKDLLGPWLHAVATKTAHRARVNALRRRMVEGVGSKPEIEPIDGSDPSRVADRAELRALLDEEVGRLPEKYRMPLVLCYFDGKTHDEAAALLRWPVGTVRGRLARARDRLRDRLTRRGLTLGAGLSAALLAGPEVKAALSPALVGSTVRAALFFATGPGAAAGLVSATAATLGQDILRTMLMTKLKLAAAVGLMAVGVAATGAAVHAVQDSTPAPTSRPSARTLPSAPAEPAAPAVAETPVNETPSAPASPAPPTERPATVTIDGETVPTPASDPFAAPTPAARPSAATLPAPVESTFPAPASPAEQPKTVTVLRTVIDSKGRPVTIQEEVPVAADSGRSTQPPELPRAIDSETEPPPDSHYLVNPLRDHEPEDVAAYLEQTRRKVAATIERLTTEENDLNQRLAQIRPHLEQLREVQRALGPQPSSPIDQSPPPSSRKPRPRDTTPPLGSRPSDPGASLPPLSPFDGPPEVSEPPFSPAVAGDLPLPPGAVEPPPFQETDYQPRLQNLAAGEPGPPSREPSLDPNPPPPPLETPPFSPVPGPSTRTSERRLREVESKLDRLLEAIGDLQSEIKTLKNQPTPEPPPG